MRTSRKNVAFPMDSEVGDKKKRLHLKREVGLFSAVSLIAGTMIGSGIFMSPEWVLYYMGSPGGSLIIWAACGLLVMLISLCYAEIGTIITESGGEYIYLLRIFGPLPAFLLMYTSVFVVRPAGIAGVSLSFAQYVTAPFYQSCSSPQSVVKCTAAACVLVLLIVNTLNVKLATTIHNIFTAAKVIALMIIVVGGIILLANGHFRNLQNAFHGTVTGFGPVGTAFYQGLWSFDGWNNLNYVTEELQNPHVNLPRALMIAVPLVTILYVLVNVSYFAAMTPVELLSSEAVAVTWGNKVLANWMWLIPLSVALSTFGSVNGTFFTGGRVCYVAAREGHMFEIMSMIQVRRLTPSPALIFTALIALIMIAAGDFHTIVNYVSFTAWMCYGLILVGILYLRYKKPDIPRPCKVPIVIPVIVLIVAIYLVLAPIIDSPQTEYIFVIFFILSGIIFYLPLIHFKLHPGFMSTITLHLQLLLDVAPADEDVN
ncbi:b(0,+)-type amino acid transporter 1-like [Protopterus annectens]|uniref:b(0,+)-type amino acid transporter 1-like n=1 Tax=Protopterus annectens TaxID=7888 RepID=UPI001CFB1BD2|nr:b(0,+)-type amino acid transporter 1-like [Protopterus annectens]